MFGWRYFLQWCVWDPWEYAGFWALLYYFAVFSLGLALYVRIEKEFRPGLQLHQTYGVWSVEEGEKHHSRKGWVIYILGWIVFLSFLSACLGLFLAVGVACFGRDFEKVRSYTDSVPLACALLILIVGLLFIGLCYKAGWESGYRTARYGPDLRRMEEEAELRKLEDMARAATNHRDSGSEELHP